MDRIVKIGIIGCGGIANGKHMPSLAKVENVLSLCLFCGYKFFHVRIDTICLM